MGLLGELTINVPLAHEVSFEGHKIQKQILRLGSLCDSQITGGHKSIWTSTQNTGFQS